jgi:NAD(P)H-hydrate repair Nnr-like enzyme with NAD(P)H-hydrate dehydratase domain
MNDKNWLKQTKDKPLYPDLIWGRPENRKLAGKLLIIGGNSQSFNNLATAYSAALTAKVGMIRAILPDVLRPNLVKIFPEASYAPSTPSGSFARSGLSILFESANWADGVLLAGDFGHNSETAILLEQFINQYDGLLGLSKDSLDYFTNNPLELLKRKNTMLVLNLGQLQKIAIKAKFSKAFTFDMDLIRLVSTLQDFTKEYSSIIIVKHLSNICIGLNNQVITTKLEEELSTWTTETSAKAITWWLQNPNQPLEAIASSLV